MNKIVVITGASSGIGEQLKKHYEKDGNTVVNLSKIVEKEDELNIMIDVTDREKIFKTFELIYNQYQRIDVLINCAGYGVFGAIELLTEQQCKQIFDVNFFGTLWCCQAAAKYMKKGSRIVNISSASALFALPYRTMYSASKSAVSMLSFGLNMELKDFGISVTCICPGDIKTNFSKNRDVTIQTNEKYGDSINLSYNKITSKEHKRMDKEVACEKIYKICIKKRVKPMYIIGGKYKFLNFAKRLASTGAILAATKKHF